MLKSSMLYNNFVIYGQFFNHFRSVSFNFPVRLGGYFAAAFKKKNASEYNDSPGCLVSRSFNGRCFYASFARGFSGS